MSKLEAIDTFQKKVAAITDDNYGDFMRKSNTYLNQLLVSYSDLKPDQRDIFIKMKNEIQYSPEWDVDTTLMKLKRHIHQLKKLES